MSFYKESLDKIINKSEVQINDELEEGGEAKVYIGKYIENDVVIKKYKKEEGNHMKEIIAYCKLSHEYMVKYYGYYIDEDNTYNLILEHAKGVSLQDAIVEERLNYTQKIDVLDKICDFLIYLRKNHVIHRDLKPDNIKIEIIDNEIKLKLLDFGITKISDNTLTITNNPNKFTINYSAPELYIVEDNFTVLSYKIDIWALGCIASYLFSGNLPWTNIYKNPIKIQTCLIMQMKFPIPDGVDVRIVPFIEICTSVLINKRPNPYAVKRMVVCLKEGINLKEEILKMNESDYI